MRRILKHLAITILIIAVVCFAGYRYIQGNLDRLAKTPIAEIDLSKIANGTYRGKCVSFPITVIVDVVVENHSFNSIILIQHTNGQGQGAEALPDRIVAAQSLQVDTVAGATYSSKAMLLAVTDALKP
ncbi:MAG: FMN-binding protein [Erysipelotrichales bacterium]|nr:MAG: FMN-binding protein [Erysipelotrichales bacterium]